MTKPTSVLAVKSPVTSTAAPRWFGSCPPPNDVYPTSMFWISKKGHISVQPEIRKGTLTRMSNTQTSWQKHHIWIYHHIIWISCDLLHDSNNSYWLSRMKRQEALTHVPTIIQHKSPYSSISMFSSFSSSRSHILTCSLLEKELAPTYKRRGNCTSKTPTRCHCFLESALAYSSVLLDSSATVSSFSSSPSSGSSSSSSSSSSPLSSSPIFISPLLKSLAA